MQLLINDSQVDFELEKEKTIDDVLNSLEHWGREQGLFLTDAFVDDEEVLLAQPSKTSARHRNLDSVREVRVTFASKYTYATSLLLDLQDYLNRMAGRLKKESLNAEDLGILIDNLRWLKEGFLGISNILELETESAGFWEHLKPFEIGLFELKEALQGAPNPPKQLVARLYGLAEQLLEEAKPLFFKANLRVLQQGLQDLQTKKGDKDWGSFLKDCTTHLIDVKQMLTESATAFHSGKDALAMRYVRVVIDTFCLFVSLFNGIHKSMGNDDLGEWAKQLNQHLLTIEEALGKRDYIHLSDILEYELVGAVDELINKMKSKNFPKIL